MTTYSIDYSYSVPEWGNLVTDADSKDEAEDLFHAEIARLYPEAYDIEITEIKEV